MKESSDDESPLSTNNVTVSNSKVTKTQEETKKPGRTQLETRTNMKVTEELKPSLISSNDESELMIIEPPAVEHQQVSIHYRIDHSRL